MAWIESHTILLRHRKLIALAKALLKRPLTKPENGDRI